MNKPDIFVFMSDQHAPQFMGNAEIDVDTPNLDCLKRDGTVFDNAYTPCPLCVPARMAMMSGLRPAKTGIFTNVNTLSSTIPTFVHYLAADGYETVLAGRMHFLGTDQRHGFTKRIAPDMTLVTWKRPEHIKKERGVYARTFAGKWSTEVVGGGESPVLLYDEMVVDAAMEYLKKPHEKPQFIVVGTYGPHFPYVAPKELFQKYWDRVEASPLYNTVTDAMNECLLERRVKASPEVAKGVRSAYCGMVERMDEQIGKVREAFEEFTRKRKTQKIFCYISDHGDQTGERDLYGKETFYEKSSRIPMIFAGDGIVKNHCVKAPVSLLDFGATMCDLAQTALKPKTDGVSLKEDLEGGGGAGDRIVLSEFMEKKAGDYHYGLMLRQKKYKFVTYRGFEKDDQLFDVEEDPLETKNLSEDFPEILDDFRRKALEISPHVELYEENQRQQDEDAKLFIAYEEAVGLNEEERWRENPVYARKNPEICIAGLPVREEG